jgi:peptidoglycan-associated lipoprotein
MEEGFKEEGLGEEGFPASNGDVSDDEIAEPSPFARQDEDEAGSAGEGEAGAESDGSAEALADAGASAGAQADEAKLLAFHPTTELKDILFKFDRFDLDETSITILKNNAQFLKEHPTVKIQIQGHSDERGTNNYNLALGERRSTSIKNFLVAQGVEPDRIFVLSYGEEKPFCFESNETCWQENRRAHFMVTEEHGESKF